MAGNDFCIFGRKPIIEAFKAGKRFDKILLLKTAASPEVNEIEQLARQHGTPCQKVPKEKLDSVVRKYARHHEPNHQGVIGFLAMIEYHTIDDVLHHTYANSQTPLLVVLDGVTDVGNFGAIARSAECLGAQALIIAAQGAAQINAEAMKASAGALNRILVCKENSLVIALKLLRANGIKVFATVSEAGSEISKVDFSVPCAIVMGSEGSGVSPELLKLCDEKIAIPMKGETSSLNVSVAAGIILYEANRGR